MSARPRAGPVQVLHLFNAVRHSGAERTLLSALDEFEHLGVQVRLLAMAAEQESSLAADFAAAGVVVDHLEPTSWVRFALAYVRHMRTTRPDIVHVHPERASVLTSILPRLCRIPVVRSVHAGFDFPPGLRRRKTIERRLCRWFGVRFVTVGPYPQANESSAFANPSECIVNWFDPERFHLPSPAERAAARRAFALPDDARVIALVGNCEDVKHHDLLFDAVTRTTTPERWHVLHAGTGPLEDAERRHADEVGLAARVRFLGMTDDVPRVFAAADVHALPSRREGLSIASLEALACGLATVVTDSPGLRELAGLVDGITVVTPDPALMAEALERCVATDSGSARADRAEQAAQRFGLARGTAQYAALYRTLLRRSAT